MSNIYRLKRRTENLEKVRGCKDPIIVIYFPPDESGRRLVRTIDGEKFSEIWEDADTPIPREEGEPFYEIPVEKLLREQDEEEGDAT